MAEKKYELIKESKITESREIGTDLSHLTKYNEYDKDRGEYVSYYKPEDIRKERKKLKEKRKALKKDECEYEDIFNTSNFVKPKLLEETYNLYRIRALKDFGDVKAGDLGGYIESERNLSQEGDCWVYDKAKVTDEAKIYGNAKIKGYVVISDNAEVFDNAKVYDYAEVSGNAKVYGNAQVEDSAKIYNKVEVFDNALIDKETTLYNKAKVYGNAKVTENAELHDEVQVYGNAKIDNARLYDKAQVYGKAKVFGDATVSENAKVYDKAQICNARVTDNAQVYGEAQVYGKGVEIRDNAQVYDKAKIEATRGTLYNYKCKIEGNAQVYGNAEVFNDARILGNAKVFGDALITGKAQVYGNAKVYDNSQVYGKAQVYENAEVYDNAKIYGNAEVFNNAKVYEKVEISGNAKVYDNAQVSGNIEIIGMSKIFANAKINGNALIKNCDFFTDYSKEKNDNFKEKYKDLDLDKEIKKYENFHSEIIKKYKLNNQLPDFRISSQKGVLYESEVKKYDTSKMKEVKSLIGMLNGEDFLKTMDFKNIEDWKKVKLNSSFSIQYKIENENGEEVFKDYKDYKTYIKDFVENKMKKMFEINPYSIEEFKKGFLEKTNEEKEKEIFIKEELKKYENHYSDLLDRYGKLVDRLPNFIVEHNDCTWFDKSWLDNENSKYETESWGYFSSARGFIKDNKGQEYYDNMNMKDIREWGKLKEIDDDIIILYVKKDKNGEEYYKEYSTFEEYSKETFENLLTNAFKNKPESIEVLRKEVLEKNIKKNEINHIKSKNNDIEQEKEKEKNKNNKEYDY